MEKGEVVEITEDLTKEPFRLFGNIDPVWFDVPKERNIEASFYIRPMKSSEKAVFKASEDGLRRSMDHRGAMVKAGLSSDRFLEVPNDKATSDEKAEFTRKSDEDWALVQRNLITDNDAVEQFAETCKKITVACVEAVKFGGEERPFTGDLYEKITDDSIKVWVLDCIDKSSSITDGERVGL